MFLVNKASNNDLGYMALNKKFGFIFLDNNTDIAHTIAHEIGHGNLVLKHTFAAETSGSSQNLMDYNNGELFNQQQFRLIHDPNLLQNLLSTLVQDEDAGALTDQDVEKNYSYELSSCDPNKAPTNIKALAQRAINCDEQVDDEAVAYSETVFKTLCIDQRINLIKCIAGGLDVPDDDEKTIIRLIKSTPNNQIKELFTRLEANQSELLLKLISVVSDVGEDNYSTMMLTFVELFQKRKMGNSLETIYWGIINESTYYEGSNVEAVFQSNGKLKLQGVYTYKTQNTGNIWGPEYAQLNHDNVSPFGPINFTFIGLPVQSSVGNGFQVGKSYKVPALFVYFIRDKVWKGIMQAVAWDAVQLATAPAALGEIKAAKGLWKAFNIILTVGNSGGYILNSVPIASQINTTAEGREFLFWYNRCLMIANIGYISPFAYKFSKSLVQSYPAVKSKLQSILSQNEFKKVDDAVNEIAGSVSGAGSWLTTLKSNATFTSYFDGLANGTITRKFVNILSIEEEAILKFYTTNPGFQNFNRALRGEIPMTDFYTAQKNLMEQALTKLPNSSYNGSQSLLYRIENLTETQISGMYVEGSTINTSAFISSTYSENAIIDALRSRSYTVLIRIEGKNGKLIEDLSTLPSEKEILFKTGTNFKVVQVGFSPNPDDYMTPIKTIWLKEL